jgi:Domain of unknown function (DUF932)
MILTSDASLELELPVSASNALQGNNLSAKYQMIKTSDVLDIMIENNFVITQVHSLKPRVRDPRSVEHFIRLRHRDNLTAINGSVPEILVVNSHDGSTSLRLDAALFRIVCGNGLVVKSHDIYAARLRHLEITEERVITEAMRVIDSARESARRIELFMSRVLTGTEVYNLATEASEMALQVVGAHIDPGNLLASRRDEDGGPELWHVFNRVQENLVRGGITYKTKTGRNMTSRGIIGASPLVRANEKLWEIAETYL